MEFKLKTNEDQKLLDRKLVTGELHFSGKQTPSRMEVLEEAAKQLKADKTLVVVKEIKTRYGSNTADVEIHVYDNVECKNKVEPKHMIKRNEIKTAEEAKE